MSVPKGMSNKHPMGRVVPPVVNVFFLLTLAMGHISVEAAGEAPTLIP